MTDPHHHDPIIDDEVGEGPQTVLVGTEDAAQVLGIATRTVRKRINAHELAGTKINGAWFVELPRDQVEAAGIAIPDIDVNAEDAMPLMAGITRSARSGSGTGRMPEAVDLTPMAELVADLNRQLIEAAATAAIFQERNRILEEQRKTATLALESGQNELDRKIEEARATAEAEKAVAIEAARQEAAAQRDAEWRAKSWWQRLKGE